MSNIEPLDPDSPRGREVAAALSELRADVEDRLAREAAEAALMKQPNP